MMSNSFLSFKLVHTNHGFQPQEPLTPLTQPPAPHPQDGRSSPGAALRWSAAEARPSRAAPPAAWSETESGSPASLWGTPAVCPSRPTCWPSAARSWPPGPSRSGLRRRLWEDRPSLLRWWSASLRTSSSQLCLGNAIGQYRCYFKEGTCGLEAW